MLDSDCDECALLRATQSALGEQGGPPFCPKCGARVFYSALKKPTREEAVAWSKEGEPASSVLARLPIEGEFEEPSQALDRPKPSVASFLRRIADDLDGGRASTSGTDFTFSRLRIIGPGYDLFVGQYDPNRDHPHRYRKRS
jgi:hypothetical protein